MNLLIPIFLVFVTGFVLALTIRPFVRWFRAKRSAQKLGLKDRGKIFNQWCLSCKENLRIGTKKKGGGLVRWCATCRATDEEDEYEGPQLTISPPSPEPDLEKFAGKDAEYLKKLGW